jgi:arylsulfatase A-like enzyme/Tfp pilus assembly protein PilF
LLLLGSCQSSGSKKAPAKTSAATPSPLNLVLVTIDTLRADRLGCYGYSKVKTPNLDALAQRGVLFENAISSAPLTAPAHASMFTGVYPTVHKVRDTGGFVLPSSQTTLAEILQARGWDTAAFVGASVLKKSFGFNQGFAVYDDQMPKPDANREVEFPERRAGDVVDRATRWLDSQSGKPYFLWVHVFDPHSPYDPPPPFRQEYGGSLYDGEVAYTDQQLGRLFEAVAKKSKPENTLIAVLSDHGESLSEHGEFTHGIFLYDSTLRVPFLLAGPGIPAGLRVKPQVRNIDLLPTVLDLMGSPAPQGVQGASLAPTFTGKEAPAADSYIETLFPRINMNWAELRGIRTNRWKYIRSPKPELYDLSQDPAETKNVIGNHPAEVQQLEARLNAASGLTGSKDPEKVETGMVNQKTMQQLRSLGYLGGSSRQEYSLAGKGIDPKDRVDVLKWLHLAVSPDAGVSPRRPVPLLRQALATDPTNPTIYYHLGLELGRTGQRAEALKLYQNAITRGVDAAWIHSRLGHLQLQQGNRDAAIASYEKAAQLNPSDCESLSDLGLAYLEVERVADAERVYKWCLATGEQYAGAHNGLGLVSIRKQDMPSARTHFEKAVQLDPELWEAHLNLGRAYKILGDTKRARATFEAFLAKAPRAEFSELFPRLQEEVATMR